MKKFDVEITETLQRKVSVEAASQEDAERMVTQAWNNQDYVLDSGDFTGVDFKTVGEHELAETRTMDVLLVQPNAYPKKISVGTELEDLQAMVGGDIEVTYPFEDEVAIILNESGKINGLPLNRAIYTEDGDMQDIYAGDFLVVGLTEDDFGSLTSEQMQKFEEQFHQPQMFVRMGRSINTQFNHTRTEEFSSACHRIFYLCIKTADICGFCIYIIISVKSSGRICTFLAEKYIHKNRLMSPGTKCLTHFCSRYNRNLTFRAGSSCQYYNFHFSSPTLSFQNYFRSFCFSHCFLLFNTRLPVFQSLPY